MTTVKLAICPYTRLLTLLSRRHMLLIIYHIRIQSLSFNELQAVTKINTATLTRRLRELADFNLIVVKTGKTDSRLRYYTLSKRGRQLSRALELIEKT